MTNYQKIKEACQKANPELMELSFGCNILGVIGKYTSNPHNISGVYVEKSQLKYPMMIADEDKTIRYFNDDEIEILGHEPTLFDIRVLLEHNGYAVEQNFLDIANLWKYPDKLVNQTEETLNLISLYVSEKR